MNSCLYDCQLMHVRLEPKKYRFQHKMFMFYLDLDEIDGIAKQIPLFSRNRFNVYDFRDNDHIVFKGSSIKDNILDYLKTKGVDLDGGRVMLLTNVRTLGYVFNPVSFYFCFDKHGSPECAVAEIGNTFREFKPYFLSKEEFKGNKFYSRQDKHFYISPFMDLNLKLEFNLGIPDDKMNVSVNDLKGDQKPFLATLWGTRKELSFKNLLWYSLKFPLVTLKVIALIHIHAGILWFVKRIPYYRKEDNPQLQKEVYRVWRKS